MMQDAVNTPLSRIKSLPSPAIAPTAPCGQISIAGNSTWYKAKA